MDLTITVVENLIAYVILKMYIFLATFYYWKIFGPGIGGAQEVVGIF